MLCLFAQQTFTGRRKAAGANLCPHKYGRWLQNFFYWTWTEATVTMYRTGSLKVWSQFQNCRSGRSYFYLAAKISFTRRTWRCRVGLWCTSGRYPSFNLSLERGLSWWLEEARGSIKRWTTPVHEGHWGRKARNTQHSIYTQEERSCGCDTVAFCPWMWVWHNGTYKLLILFTFSRAWKFHWSPKSSTFACTSRCRTSELSCCCVEFTWLRFLRGTQETRFRHIPACRGVYSSFFKFSCQIVCRGTDTILCRLAIN